jgi:hypothetical protein
MGHRRYPAISICGEVLFPLVVAYSGGGPLHQIPIVLGHAPRVTHYLLSCLLDHKNFSPR